VKITTTNEYIVPDCHLPKHQIDSKLLKTDNAVRERKKTQIKKHIVYLKLPFRNIPHNTSKNAKLSGKNQKKTQKNKKGQNTHPFEKKMACVSTEYAQK
jgi:hypothetical protein